MSHTPTPCPDHNGWYEIPGYQGYAANRQGEILTKKTGNHTKGGNAGRYLKVAVYKDGDKTHSLQHVHDLVCRAFHGLPENGQVVLHADDDRWNNTPGNLCWGTQSQNIKDTYARGVRMPTTGKEAFDLGLGLEASNATWDPTFTPSYTPEEMLKMGVFEGKYINAVKGLPAAWYKIDKVLKPDDDPDPNINKFGIKSRQPLSVWKKNGWIKTDKNGWFEWFCHYWLGRRLGEEDKWQIGRWRSFVARHQGQIDASGQRSDTSKREKQRQGLLQWAWDSTTPFTEEQQKKNLARLKRNANVSVEEFPPYFEW